MRRLPFLLASAGIMGCGGGTSSSPPAPNVLIITVDTLREDYLSRNGFGLQTTPFVDSLVSEGIYFSHAITPIPRTTQALASLFTGLYPHGHGVRDLTGSLPGHIPVLAEAAGQAGYATVAVVSNHILTRERGLARGFDVYDFAPDSREAHETTQAAVRRLEDLTRRLRPDRYFVWVHYIDPHVPYYPPREIAEAFAPGYHGRYRLHFGDIKGGIGEYAYPRELGKKVVFQNRLPEEVNAQVRRLYAADVRATDDAIRGLVAWVQARLGPHWLVVFTADHGESLGEHDYFFDHGDYVYNPELRVPLALVFPRGHRLRVRRVIGDWVSLVDVSPTLREILGWPPAPVATEGHSLVPLIAGEKPPARAVFAECGESFYPQFVRRRTLFNIAGRFRAVILNDWKLICTPGRDRIDFELYDMKRDPYETRDLYTAGHSALPALTGALAAWLRFSPAPELVPSAEDRERLKSLGYIH